MLSLPQISPDLSAPAPSAGSRPLCEDGPRPSDPTVTAAKYDSGHRNSPPGGWYPANPAYSRGMSYRGWLRRGAILLVPVLALAWVGFGRPGPDEQVGPGVDAGQRPVAAGAPVPTSRVPTSRPAPPPRAPALRPDWKTPSARPKPSPTAAGTGAGCPLFPADNVWHARADRLPVLPASARYVAAIGADRNLHPDFGSGRVDGRPFGIPVTEVGAGQATVRVAFDYADESDRGPYPLPANARIEGGPAGDGDRHVILHDTANCKLYELFAAQRGADGSWRAQSGAIWNLRSNALRPAGWTSADAAGLPIMAGLVRYEEVAAGRIDHAIRITVPRSRDSYLWPARHAASDSGDPALPPMGLRLRLRADADLSGLGPQARVVAQAMQTYGVIVADNGSPWYLTGTEDARWDNDALRALKSLTGAQFEAVDTSGLMATADSAAVRS